MSYGNRCTEIRELGQEYDFLITLLGGKTNIDGIELTEFLDIIESRINQLVLQGNNEASNYTSRTKEIEITGRKHLLNLNVKFHLSAYFLHTIYAMGVKVIKDKGQLRVEY